MSMKAMSMKAEKAALLGAGFTTEEVLGWEADQRKSLAQAGFSQDEIDKAFGTVPYDPTPVRQYFRKAWEGVFGDENAPTFSQAVDAGFQGSVTGLAVRGKVPDTLLPENAPMAQRIASQAATLAGDLPAMIAGGVAGFVGGGGTGAAGGTVAAPGPGTVGGGLLGAGVGAAGGAFALPAGLRAVMMDAYTKGDIDSFSRFWEALSGAVIEEFKGYVVGATTKGAGNLVGGTAVKAGLGTGLTRAATLSTEVGTMVTVGAALEGEMPEPHHFLDAAVLIGGMHGSVKIAGKLRDIYAKTGVRPVDVMEDIKTDPTIREDILSSNREVPRAYEKMDETRTPETPGTELVPAEGAKGGEPPKGPPNEPPVVDAEFSEAPRMLPAPKDAAEAEARILEKISIGDHTPKDPLTWSKLYTYFVDDLYPIARVVKENAKAALDVASDPYKLFRLVRGSFGKADHFIEHGTFEFNSYANNGRGLKDILSPVKDELNGLRAYAAASRAIELEGRGKTTGLDMDAARTLVADAERTTKYEPVLRELVGYQNRVTKYLKDSGVLSDATYNAMLDANKNYVPFFRLMDPEAVQYGSGKGMSSRNPIKKIKGSERDVIDPIESVIKNTYTYLALAEKNAAGVKLIELLENPRKVRMLEWPAEKAEPGTAPRELPTPERTALEAEKGTELVRVDEPVVRDVTLAKELEALGLKDVPDEFFAIIRNNLTGDGKTSVFRDGKRETYKVPPDIERAFKAADLETANLIIRVLAVPARTLRAGAVLSPEFMARNVARDFVTAFVNSKGLFTPWDTIGGFMSLIKKDEAYQKWLKSGGANSTMVSLDRQYLQENLLQLDKATDFTSAAWNVVKSPVGMLRVVSELMENSTRLGEFKKVAGDSNAKADIQAAGYASREVTLDFSRIGAKMRALNMIAAFANAQVQGFDRTVREAKTRPLNFAMKVGMGVTAPSLLLWYANKDDERYKDLPDWQKDMFWIVATDDWQKVNDPSEVTGLPPYLLRNGGTEVNRGTLYRIPKPFEIGVLFGSGAERIAQSWFEHDPEAFKGFAGTLASITTVNVMPTAVAPIIEGATNHSFFQDGPLVPQYYEKELPEYRYAPYTTETAKVLSRALGTLPPLKHADQISPMVLENYVRQWTGSLGMLMLQTADAGLRKTGALPDPIKPADTLADVPVVKAFVVRHPSARAQSIQDFYTAFSEAEQVYTTVQRRAKEGDIDAVLRESSLAPEAMFRLNGIREALTNQGRFIRMVDKNQDMTPTEKRQLIDAAYYQMIEIAQTGNAIAKEAKRVLRGEAQ